jgi:hypothetical protein
MMATATRTPWKMAADEVVTCNCAWGCPCQFNALPTTGRCEALVAMRIRQGNYGETRLDGITFAAAYWWPKAIHEGNGVVRLAIDDKATPDQRGAILNIASGKQGGTFFEIFASVVSTALEPMYVPITFQEDREKRVASLKVPGLGEFRAAPIVNPVTGQEHRARIQLPNGFEYKEAEIANCVMQKVTLGDKKFENQNTYAQFAAVEFSHDK